MTRTRSGLRSFAFAVIDALVRPGLLWFARRHPRPASAPPAAVAELDRERDALNRAAEQYFVEYRDSAHLAGKPFTEPAAFSRRLIDIGVLIDGLRLRPGDTVLDLGAGTCWVSHWLNRLGCRTIAVDVSPTALDLGRRLFDADPRTNWSLAPAFIPYDGQTLPVGDRSVDAIVLYDAFHHLPNPERMLRELRRVLKDDGIAGMSEPGRGHAESAPSRAESGSSGVLERELVVEDIAEQARAAGFAATRMVLAANTPTEIDATDLRAFMGGRGFSAYWASLCAALDTHYYVLLFAGDPQPTTRRPKHLKALIAPANGTARVSVRRGERGRLAITIRNVGDTRWLAGADAPGWTRLGAHLSRVDTSTPLDRDWFRASVPSDVSPGETVTLPIELPAIDELGSYEVAFDLVVEGMTWFAERESAELRMRVDVTA